MSCQAVLKPSCFIACSLTIISNVGIQRFWMFWTSVTSAFALERPGSRNHGYGVAHIMIGKLLNTGPGAQSWQ